MLSQCKREFRYTLKPRLSAFGGTRAFLYIVKILDKLNSCKYCNAIPASLLCYAIAVSLYRRFNLQYKTPGQQEVNRVSDRLVCRLTDRQQFKQDLCTVGLRLCPAKPSIVKATITVQPYDVRVIPLTDKTVFTSRKFNFFLRVPFQINRDSE